MKMGLIVYEHQSRIDILFKGVEGLHLVNTFLDSFLKIHMIPYNQNQVARIGFNVSNISEEKRLFALDSKERRSFMISYGCHMYEDQGETHEPSHF